MMKRLTKSKNKTLFGVCGGIAEYFGIDPTWVRLGAAMFACFYGVGLIVYIAGVMVMPDAAE